MSITTYLRDCHRALKDLTDAPALQKVSFVIGNESADLDSCVSSIAYGYLATIKSKTHGLTIPVLNMPREDIQLRAELALLLDSVSVSQADLICRDDLPAVIRQSSGVSFVLLDHNHFAVEGFESKNVTVKGIIDHHVDEKLYLGASPRVIRPCGSCTSLVVDYFADLWKQDQIPGETTLTRMALSTILVDTSRLAIQTTETDFDVVKFLRSRLTEHDGWSEKTQYKALVQAKRDITGLSFAQLLRRDYKEWNLDELGLWGISSITTSLEHLLGMDDWRRSLAEHCKNRKLDVYIIMTKHGEKELLMKVINREKDKFANQFVEVASTEMLLKPWTEKDLADETIQTFQQGELSATRKKVASICQAIKPSSAGTDN